jgi:hypothetical protein
MSKPLCLIQLFFLTDLNSGLKKESTFFEISKDKILELIYQTKKKVELDIKVANHEGVDIFTTLIKAKKGINKIPLIKTTDNTENYFISMESEFKIVNMKLKVNEQSVIVEYICSSEKNKNQL